MTSNVFSIYGPGRTFRGVNVKMIATKCKSETLDEAIKRGQKMFAEYGIPAIVCFNPRTEIYNVVRTLDALEYQQVVEQLGGRIVAVLTCN